MTRVFAIGTILCLATLVVLSLSSCSSDSSPVAHSYPLTLSIDSDAYFANTSFFYFHVTRNGLPLAGAKLRRTNFPDNQTYDLGIQSDTSGNFPVTSFILSSDTTATAYQAMLDSLTSNYIRWPE